MFKFKNPLSKKTVVDQTKPTVQYWLPINDINDGVVHLKNGKYIKMIEVVPINFKLKTFREKKNILLNYKAFLKGCNFNIQIVIQSRKANIDPHLKMMADFYSKEGNENVRIMNLGYTNLVKEMVSKKKSISRRFFIVFPYEKPLDISIKNIKFDDIVQDLNQKRDKIRDFLKKCGNKIIERKTLEENKELMNIYYSLLNIRLSNIQKLDPDPSDYLGIVVANKDTATSKKVSNEATSYGELLDKGNVKVVDLISPSYIDTRNPNYIMIDDVYIANLLVVNYANKQSEGWLNDLYSISENVNISLFYEKLDKTKVINDITYAIGNTGATLQMTADNAPDLDELETKFGDAKYIRKKMNIDGDDIYYLYIYITVFSEDEQELKYTLSSVESILNSMYLQSRRANFRQEQTLKAVLPLFMNDSDDIKDAARRNVLTSALASTYPFVSAELCDNDGIFYGLNDHNKSIVMVDQFNSSLYKNANMVVLGTSGSGKTFLLNLIAGRHRLQQTPVMIIAPLKGHEFKKLCDSFDGQFIRLSPASGDCINIMEIRKGTMEYEFEEDEEINLNKKQSSILLAKIQKLHIFFSLLFKGISDEESQHLDEKLIKVYEEKGITFDNESLYSDEIGSNLSLKRKFKIMPVLGDLYTLLEQDTNTKRLATLLKKFVSGSLKSFNQQTNVNLDNKYIVADISELKGEVLTLGMFIAVDCFWDIIKEDMTQKKVFIVDELWKLIGSVGNKLAAEFVFEIFKIIRGYGGAAIAGTQDIADFFALEDGKYGKGIINNSKLKFVLQLEVNDINALKDVLSLSDEEIACISSCDRGHGLFYAGDSHILIEVVASEEEEELITTDRKRRQEIKNKIISRVKE